MGLIDKLLGKDESKEIGPIIIPDSIKFIDYRFIVFVDISQKKKQVEEVALDLQAMLMDTQASYSKAPKNGLLDYNSFVGCTNTALGKNIMLTMGERPKYAFGLSKMFVPSIDKEKKRWKISLTPIKDGKVDQYSLMSMHNDAPILAQASEWIKEYLGTQPEERNGSSASYDVDIFDGEPVMIQKDPPLSRAFSVRGRLEAAKKYPKLDFEQFNETAENTLNRIIKDIEKGIGGKKEKEWAKLTKKLLKKENN